MNLTDITTITASAKADALGVTRFTSAMTRKLREKRLEGRRGWNREDECSMEDLKEMLIDHIRDGDGDMVDVANFAMMIWNRKHPTGRPPE